MHRTRHWIVVTLCVFLGSVSLQAQWSTDSISVPRQQVSAVSADGKAYFAGGRDQTTFSNVIDIYHPASDTWATGTLSSARTGVGVAAVGDYVLFAGGAISLGASTAIVDFLHTPSGVWSSTAALSETKFNAGVTVLGTRAFFAGGTTGGALNLIPSDVVDIYDAALGPPDDPDAWSTATLSEARGAPVAVTVGDQVVVAGGVTSGAPCGPCVTGTVDIYDDSTGLWTRAAPLSQARTAIGATAAGTRAYFAGGGLAAGGVSDVLDIYDSQDGTWTTGTLSEPRFLLSAVTLGDTVLFAGGKTAPGTVSEVVEFLDVDTGAWGPAWTLAEPRGDMGVTTLGTRAFFAGGIDADSLASTFVEVYDSRWTNLGGGTVGVAGQPTLTGDGSLVGGTGTEISLTNAPPFAFMLAWVSFAPTPFAALDGTVHAHPFASQIALPADGFGVFSGATTWPTGVPPGTQVWFQFLVQDLTTVHGITLSNGMRATTP